MNIQSGELFVSGKTALVSQTPWIQNLSVRDNVLFGQPIKSSNYYEALRLAALNKDLEKMPAGDQTEARLVANQRILQVGERGVTLSGGQRARVALARALFANRDIYLLDDVLASLDKKVADEVFDKAIIGHLANKKTTLLVTNCPRVGNIRGRNRQL
jgi:ABC-type multidrug transport system fused ATPase/permease subunit